MKVFWSWQSDTPGKTGRHFVREALSKAISDLKDEIELDEPTGRDPRTGLHLDQDRQGVPGSPDLARVILEKISKASVFVADVTAVGTTRFGHADEPEKKLINANVAIELGYALGTAGDSALLMVMNEHYGSRDDLPFDLKSKAGPLIFRLAPDATKDEITAATRKLTSQLKEAIALCLRLRVEEIKCATPFPAAEAKDGPARFRAQGKPIGIRSDNVPFGMGSEERVFLLDGPAIWLRVMPLFALSKRWPSHDLRHQATQSGSFDLRPISQASPIFGIRAEDGFGLCVPVSLPDDTRTLPVTITASVVFAFETGEIWSVDTEYLRYSDQRIPFLEGLFVQRLQSYARFLGSLGIEPKYRWVCGMTGIEGYRLLFPTPSGFTGPGPGPQCLSSTIEKEGLFDGKESAQSALVPFFKEIFDRCGIPRPSHLPQ